MAIAILGVGIWLLTLFQVLVGLRVFKLGRRHRTVHKWVGLAILGLGPVHGLLAWSFFLGLPFVAK